MKLEFDLQRHAVSGEMFALAYEGDIIAGIAGPLSWQDLEDMDGGLGPVETPAQAAEIAIGNADDSMQDVAWARVQPWHHPLHQLNDWL